MSKLKALERLIEALAKLPSIGKKSAERMAFAMLEMDDEELKEFADSVIQLKAQIHLCPICGNLTEEDICPICKDASRDKETVLVVSTPKDIQAFEKTEEYHGLYHVLGGTISLSKGIGVDELNINSLLERIKSGVKEVIIATNPTLEGETTALYLAKLLETNNDIKVTRIAYGLPMGGNLDYADSLTLSKAIEGRRQI